jgi:hypothetical protein
MATKKKQNPLNRRCSIWEQEYNLKKLAKESLEKLKNQKR